ncbi:hypothetical protein Salat_0242600 [Sesamum alatum]|uniref:Uncharacterized protein n=1 Tax=Sesamum alatum TaxID=300844 RepID=A0AAE1Z0C6_9LAMI|nr:hypothetical protein Salat_0242600 [Sesamum alatum]
MNEIQVGYKLARLKRKRELYVKRHRGVNSNSVAEILTRIDMEYQQLSELHNRQSIINEEPSIYMPTSRARRRRGSSTRTARGRSNQGSSSRTRNNGPGGRTNEDSLHHSQVAQDGQELAGHNGGNQPTFAVLSTTFIVNGGNAIVDNPSTSISLPSAHIENREESINNDGDRLTTPTVLYSIPIVQEYNLGEFRNVVQEIDNDTGRDSHTVVHG